MVQPQGLWAIHSAVLLFSITALFSKLIELPAFDITPLRSIFATLVLLAYIRIRRQSLALNNLRHYALVILLGLLLAIHWVTYFHAMQVSTIAVGVIALYTYPVITVFLEPLFHGEKPGLMDIFSACAVLLGIYMMMPVFDWNNETTQGILWGVFSALLFARTAHHSLQCGFDRQSRVAAPLLPATIIDTDFLTQQAKYQVGS